MPLPTQGAMNSLFAKPVHAALQAADITVNGDRPFDVQIHDPRILNRVATYGSIGLGDGYVDGWWDCDNIPEAVSRLLRTGADQKLAGMQSVLLKFAAVLQNAQTPRLALTDVAEHYNIGNELYVPMLGPTMAYSCGFWERAKTLDTAQRHKFDRICRKLRLQPGQRILEVGCGWGSFAKYATEHYGVTVTGITVSTEQARLAQELCAELPVDIRVMDYRSLSDEFPFEYFDHIVSVGMFEHVGPKNYREYFTVLAPLLKPDGLFLLHTIGGVKCGADPWIDRYIFHGGYIPSMDQIVTAMQGFFIAEDVENFGADYDKTLCAWERNFVRAWPKLQATGKYDERFYRMWRYYLLSCAGGFRARTTQLWQFVLSKSLEGGYRSIR